MKTCRRHDSPVKSMSVDNNSNNLLEDGGSAAKHETPLSISHNLCNDIVDCHCMKNRESDQENLLSGENSSISDKVKYPAFSRS